MKKPDLHILMLEDEQLDVELNKAQLALLDEYNCIIKVVGDKASYLNALKDSIPDLILSDYNLPQYNGLNALRDLKEINIVVPFIFVTGTLSEETAAETIKAGAWDYVVKDRLFRLPLAVRSVLKLREEKRAATLAEEKVNRLITAIEKTSTQIFVCNDRGEIEYVNNRFTGITGYTLQQALGMSVYDMPGDNLSPETVDDIKQKLAGGEVFSGEILSKTSNGQSYWAIFSLTPIRNEEGRLISIVGVKEDITRRKMMEQELIEALDKAERSDRLKDAFLQNLSHEIRTPLNAIVGFSNLLSQEDTTDITKEYTSIIRDSSHQLLTIVSDILTMASIQTGQETLVIKPVNINNLITRLSELFFHTAKEKNLKFIMPELPGDKPLLMLTDETKLFQILTNLLSNAFKFTHHGSVGLALTLHDNMIDLSVSDTGIGISEESLAVIFERFRQAEDNTHIEYGGTGLGLAISLSFAQMLGGTIAVRSEPAKGSVFTLSLPFREATSEKEDDASRIFIPSNRKLTILVVEDEINNYLLIKALLNHSNLKLVYAENGVEAVKACQSNPAIDLVLMDIKMPLMDGITALGLIKERRKDLPVIAQTAYGLEREKQQFLEQGFDGYISKPISKEELFTIIKQNLSKLI